MLKALIQKNSRETMGTGSGWMFIILGTAGGMNLLYALHSGHSFIPAIILILLSLFVTLCATATFGGCLRYGEFLETLPIPRWQIWLASLVDLWMFFVLVPLLLSGFIVEYIPPENNTFCDYFFPSKLSMFALALSIIPFVAGLGSLITGLLNTQLPTVNKTLPVLLLLSILIVFVSPIILLTAYYRIAMLIPNAWDLSGILLLAGCLFAVDGLLLYAFLPRHWSSGSRIIVFGIPLCLFSIALCFLHLDYQTSLALKTTREAPAITYVGVSKNPARNQNPWIVVTVNSYKTGNVMYSHNMQTGEWRYWGRKTLLQSSYRLADNDLITYCDIPQENAALRDFNHWHITSLDGTRVLDSASLMQAKVENVYSPWLFSLSNFDYDAATKCLLYRRCDGPMGSNDSQLEVIDQSGAVKGLTNCYSNFYFPPNKNGDILLLGTKKDKKTGSDWEMEKEYVVWNTQTQAKRVVQLPGQVIGTESPEGDRVFCRVVSFKGDQALTSIHRVRLSDQQSEVIIPESEYRPERVGSNEPSIDKNDDFTFTADKKAAVWLVKELKNGIQYQKIRLWEEGKGIRTLVGGDDLPTLSLANGEYYSDTPVEIKYFNGKRLVYEHDEKRFGYDLKTGKREFFCPNTSSNKREKLDQCYSSPDLDKVIRTESHTISDEAIAARKRAGTDTEKSNIAKYFIPDPDSRTTTTQRVFLCRGGENKLLEEKIWNFKTHGSGTGDDTSFNVCWVNNDSILLFNRDWLKRVDVNTGQTQTLWPPTPDKRKELDKIAAEKLRQEGKYYLAALPWFGDFIKNTTR